MCWTRGVGKAMQRVKVEEFFLFSISQDAETHFSAHYPHIGYPLNIQSKPRLHGFLLHHYGE